MLFLTVLFKKALHRHVTSFVSFSKHPLTIEKCATKVGKNMSKTLYMQHESHNKMVHFLKLYLLFGSLLTSGRACLSFLGQLQNMSGM
jgi:hypothetical protein